ncbi:ATP-binding protein [Streptomyces albospinus]|uniref:ATP-binding protein n=1 Tax=Streptomyces albospinus TaxID=285515 RepID=A0ABQ2UM37_9ACTN|nr:AAA family ATPase [Streptomyces albospinus]GGU44452.1 ATP-binding protein [Streptomyces albospinus]
MHREAAYAATSGRAPADQADAASGTRRRPPSAPRPGRRPRITDLRGARPARRTAELRFPPGDLVVVSGLPGSGKSTLMRRLVPPLDACGAAVHRIDSQDARERWEGGRLRRLPYGLYRPLVRAAHYLALRRALRSGGSVVVHDCGTLAWVRRWISRVARRRGRGLHLVLLDVPPEVALTGQRARGRGVSWYAFARHRRAVRRLVGRAEDDRLPDGFGSAVLLDRRAAGALEAVSFG